MSSPIRFALHGGAGDAAGGAGHDAHRAILREIADEAGQWLRQGRSAIEVVERAVTRLEDCPLFNAGVGAVLNRDGAPELDAAIMDGRDRACGAVAGVARVRNPVQLARAVMEKSPHVLFTGAGAEAFARAQGFAEVTPDTFITEERFHQLKEAHRKGLIALDHDDAIQPDAVDGDDKPYGTVGAVARDREGHLAAATSTGGMTNKHPGRVGDTPLVGAGTFADDSTVALSCTGTGEAYIRAGFGFHVHARMAWSGWPLDRACADALAQVRRFGGRGGVIAIGHDGALALPFNSRLMFRAWIGADGAPRVAVGPDPAS